MRSLAVALTLLALPASAFAGEAVYQFRSVEDPNSPADLGVCAAAPFRYDVTFGASLYVELASFIDGKIVLDSVRKIGTATACANLTDFTFPPGLQQQFYVQFNLPEGAVTAYGTCTLVSNDMPQAGLVLAGCALKVLSAPAGTLGGDAASASVFNPAKLAGYDTGSQWTLHLYTNPSAGDGPGRDHSHHEHDLEHVTDGRSDAEIATHKK